jgi:hypothetical protein
MWEVELVGMAKGNWIWQRKLRRLESKIRQKNSNSISRGIGQKLKLRINFEPNGTLYVNNYNIVKFNIN